MGRVGGDDRLFPLWLISRGLVNALDFFCLMRAPVRVSLFCTYLHPRRIEIHERSQGRQHAVRSTQPSVERMKRIGTRLSTLAVHKVFVLQAAGIGTAARQREGAQTDANLDCIRVVVLDGL